MNKNRTQIHATNINGLGASQVVISFLQASINLGVLENTTIFLPENDTFDGVEIKAFKINRYKRILPNPISRVIECVFSNFFFLMS